MIRHTIIKHKPRVPVLTQVVTHTNLTPSRPPHITRSPGLTLYGKLEYARYIASLPVSKGDYVYPIGVVRHYPLSKDQVWRVRDIQEIHYLCEGILTSPRPIQIVNLKGETKWVGPAEIFQTHHKEVFWDDNPSDNPA